MSAKHNVNTTEHTDMGAGCRAWGYAKTVGAFTCLYAIFKGQAKAQAFHRTPEQAVEKQLIKTGIISIIGESCA